MTCRSAGSRGVTRKKPTASLVRSSAAEYLTFVAASGTGAIEAVYRRDVERSPNYRGGVPYFRLWPLQLLVYRRSRS
jgi:hypothetical protein